MRISQMRILSRVPVSVLAFPIVAILYGLQMIPLIGVVLMVLGAPLWTGALLNLGMLGLALETPVRRFGVPVARTSLMWLLIPFAYFGWYFSIAYSDHRALQNLRSQFDVTNASVSIPFDQDRHALVFKGGANSYNGTLTQDFGLHVAYAEKENITQGYLSTRLLEREMCDEIRGDPVMRSAFIHVYGFHDGEPLGRRRLASRHCSLTMPDKPSKPIVEINSILAETSVEGLPVKLVENRVLMPDGNEFVLKGGTAAPFPWFPRPILGCVLNSGAPSWDCFKGFSRDSFTPIVSTQARYGADVRVLAIALGLAHTAPDERRATGSEEVQNRMQQAIKLQLERDIVDVREAIADPTLQLTVHSIKVLQLSPDELLSLAPSIVEGIKRAGQVLENPYRNRETGKTLAVLFGKLPIEVQETYSDDIESLYRKVDEANDGRHWLYQAGALLRFRESA
ncbi:MAG: hypothetical protein ACI8QU_000150 [Devosia litorisediminis]|jgi:hypothetical protein